MMWANDIEYDRVLVVSICFGHGRDACAFQAILNFSSVVAYLTHPAILNVWARTPSEPDIIFQRLNLWLPFPKKIKDFRNSLEIRMVIKSLNSAWALFEWQIPIHLPEGGHVH